MRLTKEQHIGIKKAFSEIFGEGDIYLFGSRVDDEKKGGDIDLYIVLKDITKDARKKKINFLVKLDQYIGEQKIDVVISKDPMSLIEKEAIENGVLL